MQIYIFYQYYHLTFISFLRILFYFPARKANAARICFSQHACSRFSRAYYACRTKYMEILSENWECKFVRRCKLTVTRDGKYLNSRLLIIMIFVIPLITIFIYVFAVDIYFVISTRDIHGFFNFSLFAHIIEIVACKQFDSIAVPQVFISRSCFRTM